MVNQKFTKNMIPIEIEIGFVRIPNKFRSLFPKTISRIELYLDKTNKSKELLYNPKHQRIYGLSHFGVNSIFPPFS